MSSKTDVVTGKTGQRRVTDTDKPFGQEAIGVLNFVSDLMVRSTKDSKFYKQLQGFINLPEVIREKVSNCDSLASLLHPKFKFISKADLHVKGDIAYGEIVSKFKQLAGELQSGEFHEEFNDAYLRNICKPKPGDMYTILYFQEAVHFDNVSLEDINKLIQLYDGVNLGVQGILLHYLSQGFCLPAKVAGCYFYVNDTGKEYRPVTLEYRTIAQNGKPLDVIVHNSMQYSEKDSCLKRGYDRYITVFVKKKRTNNLLPK